MNEHAKARMGLITATDIAKLARGGTAEWLRIKRIKQTGVDPFKGNKYTEWGNEREPHIAKQMQFLFDLEPKLDNNPIVKFETPYAATPDGLNMKLKRGGEYKTTVTDWGLVDAGHLRTLRPDYYDQCQWQMFVMDFDEVVFAYEPHIEFVPQPVKYVVIPRNEGRIQDLIEIAEQFIDYLDQPEGIGEFDDLLAEYKVRKQILDEAQSEVDEVLEQIRERAGDREKVAAESEFGKLTYYWGSARKTFDKDALAKAHPEIDLEKFMKLGKAPEKPTIRIT